MSNGLTGLSESARRYANALFELAVETGQLDAAAADMAGLRDVLEGSQPLRLALASPVVSAAEKSGVLKALGDKAKISATTHNFLGVLAQNGRAYELLAVARAFDDLVAKHKGLLTAEVASAAPLSDAQTDALKAALKSAYGRDVAVRAEVRPELIGGLVVNVGSRMFDSSIKTKLAGLAAAMKGA